MYGHRGAILAHYGWTWDYLLWGIKWHIVQKMMIDAPAYDYGKGDDKKKPKPQTTMSFADFINSAPHE